MGRHLLERSQVVQGDLETVFAFFKNPLNLEEITPPWLGFRITYVSDREVRQGTRIEYQLKWQGIPLGWTTLISEYEENVRFADTMKRGPYRRWHHVHTFEAVAEGVLMKDRVEYELPLGPLGDLVHALVVRRQLDGIFDYRRERIGELFSD